MPLGVIFFSAFIVAAGVASAQTKQLTLEEAYQKALDRSENVQVQQILTEQAENILGRARSKLLPQLDSQVSLTRQGLSTAAEGDVTQNSSSARIGINQPLFRGFSIIKGIDIADIDVQRTKLSAENTRRVLWWTVINSFYEVLASQRNFENLEALEKVFEKREREIRKRAGLGKSRSADLQVTLSQRLTVHAQVQKAKNDYKVSRLNLSQLTGLSKEEVVPIRPTPKQFTAGPLNVERPDLKAQELTVRRADFEITAAQSTLWPELNLGANYYPVYAYDAAPRSTGDLRWDAGLSLRWTLDWEDWTNKAGYDRKLNFKIEELRLKQALRLAQEELDRRILYRKGVQQQLQDLTEAVKISDKATQLIQRDYANGTSSLLDIVTQQNAYFETRRLFDTLDLENDLVNFEIQWLQGEVLNSTTGAN